LAIFDPKIVSKKNDRFSYSFVIRVKKLNMSLFYGKILCK
jgi:hypothetical protein